MAGFARIRTSRKVTLIIVLATSLVFYLIVSSHGSQFSMATADIVADRRLPQHARKIKQFTSSSTSSAFQEELDKLNAEKVDQSDPRLIKIIKEHFLLPPSTMPYNLNNPNKTDYSGQGKDYLVPNTVKDLPEDGFFLECGANDGEFLSSSLYFERQRGWGGLLIEANPLLFAELLKNRRKAHALNACLNTTPHPSIMKFNLAGAISRLVGGTFQDSYRHHGGFIRAKELATDVTEIQCFPLYSVLMAMGRTKVDYFGLDVEGSELSILKTVPLDKVNITTMLVEYSHQDGGVTPMRNYLESNGYKTLKVVSEDILVHKK